MQKIKLITDSASDITTQQANELDIHVIGFSVVIDGQIYREGIDLSTEQFYEVMNGTKDFPKTSQITMGEFVEFFENYYNAGYKDIIYVSISSTGSNTFNNATNAKAEFIEEHPNADLRIHIVDSKNYTAAQGYPIIQAARKIQKGSSADETVAFLNEWYDSIEMYFAPYTLEYVKRSGRLSAAAAFAGELLGLRPVIQLIDGTSKVPEKIRGDKNIPTKLTDVAEKNMTPKTPYIILAGSVPEYGEELAKELTKRLGYPPEMTVKIGVTIASHAGHKVAGFVIRGKNRKG